MGSGNRGDCYCLGCYRPAHRRNRDLTVKPYTGPPMTPFSERIFLAEIANQIGGARRALRRLRRASRECNTEAVYDDVADLLGHAAIVSKILCPPVNNK